MSKWHSYTTRDDQVQTDGDPYFTELDMQHDRGILSPTILARSENKRLREGPAATRPGVIAPTDFNPVFEGLIVGAGIYNNPNGDEVMLVATAGANYVWQLRYGTTPSHVNLVAGQTIPTGPCEFVQSFDKFLLLRPDGLVMLVWDGIVGHTFGVVTLLPPSVHLVPTATHAEPFEDRIIYYNAYSPTLPKRDQIVISDVLNYSGFDDPAAVFRINAGESNMITRVIGYFKGAIAILTKRSIHLLENFQLDFATARQRMLSSRLGSVGVHMPLPNGPDVMFLAPYDGFYRLSEINQDQISVQPIPFSRKIQPIIDQIDWPKADLWACSIALGDYGYFGLPMLGYAAGMANNVIAVYNLTTQKWESIDKFDDPTFEISRLLVTIYNNQRRVFAWTNSVTLAGKSSQILLLYEGVSDQIGGQILPVNDSIDTRGYTVNDPGSFKRFQRSIIGLRTYTPSARITALSDGVNEEKFLGAVTKDWQRSYVHGRPIFDPNTGDPNQDKREDYSVMVPGDNFVGQDFESLPVGSIAILPAVGAPPYNGIKQQSLERKRIRQNGRWCSIRIENSNGQCDVLGVAVEAIPAQEVTRTVA